MTVLANLMQPSTVLVGPLKWSLTTTSGKAKTALYPLTWQGAAKIALHVHITCNRARAMNAPCTNSARAN